MKFIPAKPDSWRTQPQTGYSQDQKLLLDNKTLYKSSLQSQLNEKNFKQLEYKRVKSNDLRSSNERGEAIKQWDLVKKQQATALKNELSSEYQQQINYRLSMTKTGNIRERQKDKEVLQNVQKQLEAETKQKQLAKTQQIRREKQCLQWAEQKKATARISTQKEAQLEHHQMLATIEQLNQRDRLLQSQKSKKMQETERRTQLHQSVLAREKGKLLEKDLMITQWSQEYTKQQALKAELEQQLKQQTIVSNSQALQSQIAAKQQKRQLEFHNSEKEKREVSLHVQRTQALEAAAAAHKRSQQEEYKRSLLSQQQEKQFGSQQLSPPRAEQTSLLLTPPKTPKQLPLFTQSVVPRSVSELHFTFNPHKHDPITNPIGDSFPRPLNANSLAKGRGIFLMNAGSDISKYSVTN